MSCSSAGHPWAGSVRLVKRNEAHDAIRALKAATSREIVVWGSRTLWTDLIAHGLVDELHIIVGFALLGDGTRTFQGIGGNIRRLGTREFEPSSNVLIRYAIDDVHGST